jgi:hypothetical protein
VVIVSNSQRYIGSGFGFGSGFGLIDVRRPKNEYNSITSNVDGTSQAYEGTELTAYGVRCLYLSGRSPTPQNQRCSHARCYDTLRPVLTAHPHPR